MHVFSKHQKPGNIIHLSINLLNHSTNSGLQWGSGAYFICHRAKRWALPGKVTEEIKFMSTVK